MGTDADTDEACCTRFDMSLVWVSSWACSISCLSLTFCTCIFCMSNKRVKEEPVWDYSILCKIWTKAYR